MPSSNYPELQNVPAQCKTLPPWGLEAVQVRGPYQGVNEATVELRPIIDSSWPAAKYTLFAGEDKYDNDKVGGLGYQSSSEKSVLADLRKLANNAKTNTAAVKAPGVKSAIVALAQQAYDLFGEINEEYAAYSDHTVYPLPNGNVGYFPLSVTEQQMNQQIDAAKAGIWQPARQQSRKTIRQKWHKAIRLLWCALYGHAQSEAYNQNKVIYDARGRGPQGSFAVRPNRPSTPTVDWGISSMPPPTPPTHGPGPEGTSPIPVPLPLPPTAPEPAPERMPTASKVLLGSAAALALAAGIRQIFFVPSAAPR